MPTALRTINRVPYSASAPVKSIKIPDGTFNVAPQDGGTPALQPSVQVGDLMLLSISAGASPTYSALFTGWSEITPAGGPSTWGAKLFYRFAQAGDAGSTVTVEDAAHTAKMELQLTALSGVDTGTPIAAIAMNQDTTANTSHTGPAVTNGLAAAATIAQVFFSQEGTAGSAAFTIDGTGGNAYTIVNGGRNGSTANAQVAATALSNAPIVPGSVTARTWTSDASANKNVMMAVVIAPTSTTTTVFPQTDVSLPSGTVITGGATGAAVMGDNDPNTYVDFGVSGVAVHVIERFGSVALPLNGPLQTITADVALNGATSVSVTPTLRNGTTPIATYAAHVFSANGSFTWNVPSGDQTAQVDLTNVQVDFAVTGS